MLQGNVKAPFPIRPDGRNGLLSSIPASPVFRGYPVAFRLVVVAENPSKVTDAPCHAFRARCDGCWDGFHAANPSKQAAKASTASRCSDVRTQSIHGVPQSCT